MVKWVYDKKMCTMVPQKYNSDLEFSMTRLGIKVIDHSHNLSFIIGRDDIIKMNGREVETLPIDYQTALKISQKIRRIYPSSKYCNPDMLINKRNVVENKMSADDKAMLRCLLEEVDANDIKKYVSSINEADTGYWVGLGGKSSVLQTPGTTEHGAKGLINALPSAILSFLICPPAAIMGLIGAVRHRAEQRWLKSRINPNRWLDYIATPSDKKEKIKEALKKEMAKNTQYYYTRLANGEILRVVGSSKLEAKEMIMALEHKDIIPRYASWNNALGLVDSDSEDQNSISPKNSSSYIMWVIKFDNGEACYAFGKPDASDKEDIKEKAIESRKLMVKYYKYLVYKDEDNGKTKSQRHDGRGSDDDEFLKMFSIPKIDDMIRITSPSSYKIISESNYKDFSEPQTNPMEWSANGDIVYRIKFGNMGKILLPLRSTTEVYKVLKELVKTEGTFGKNIASICNCFRNNYDKDLSYCKASGINDDFFIIPYLDQDSISSADEPKISQNDVKDKFFILESALDEIISNAEISNESKKDYKKYKTTMRQISTMDYREPEDSDHTYCSSWSKHITYQKIDSKSGEELSREEVFNEGIDDNSITTKALPQKQTQQNQQNTQQNQNQQNQNQQNQQNAQQNQQGNGSQTQQGTQTRA